MRVTPYDRVSSWMIAGVSALGGLTMLLALIWMTNRLMPDTEYVPFVVELDGGKEEGKPEETPDLESPEEEIPDPLLVETNEDLTEMSEILERVLKLSESSTQQLEIAMNQESTESSGKPGSAVGTGKPALGQGPGEHGYPREQRWFIRFDDSSAEVYARQLEFFKVELGALFKDGRLVMLTNLTAEKPTKRVLFTGKGEKRLYMTWRGGSRRNADIEIFRKAGENAEGAMIMHFYHPATEESIAKTEALFRNKKSSEIRRTYFNIRNDGAGFKFVVASQSVRR